LSDRAPLDDSEAPEGSKSRLPRLGDPPADDHDLGIDHVDDRRDPAGQAVHRAQPDLGGLGVAGEVSGHEGGRLLETAVGSARHRLVPDRRLEGAGDGGGGRRRAVRIEADVADVPGAADVAREQRPSLRIAPPTPVPRVRRTTLRGLAAPFQASPEGGLGS
jgi:hypothetical protein